MAKTSIISIAKLVVLNLFHIFATTVDSTAVEKNLLIMKFYNREKEIAELKRVQEHIQLYYFDTLSFRNRKNTFF